MHYTEFLSALQESGWQVPNKSFAHKVFREEWQASFIRLGGRNQISGHVSFVIGVRHLCLCDLEGQHHAFEKEAHCFPYILTLNEIKAKAFRYKSKLLNYEHSSLPHDGDWTIVNHALQNTLAAWLATHSKDLLMKEIIKHGQNGYIERLWLSNLETNK